MNNSSNYFESCREVKWCPGCGNYAILMSMQKTLFSLGLSNEKIVFVSGIGCSGRFPYYINTSGFHTLHGRVSAIATGLRLVRSDLKIWLVFGDGDGFSIGLSHVLHMVRRNVDVNVLFINNKVYALTKGQYSPTSDKNFITKSSPFGSIEEPINPLLMVLNAGCSFVARAIDSDVKNLSFIISEAMNHRGTSFIEVLQNCNVYNNEIYGHLTDKDVKDDNLLYLEHGKPLIFGKKNKKVLILENLKFSIIDVDKFNGYLLHDVLTENILQIMLAKILYKDVPFPVGILRKVNKDVYEDNYVDRSNKSYFIFKFDDLFN